MVCADGRARHAGAAGSGACLQDAAGLAEPVRAGRGAGVAAWRGHGRVRRGAPRGGAVALLVLGVPLAVFVVGEDDLGVAYFADDQDACAVDGFVVGL